jgi:hypothetical protein
MVLRAEARPPVSIDDLARSLDANVSSSGQQITMTLPNQAAPVIPPKPSGMNTAASSAAQSRGDVRYPSATPTANDPKLTEGFIAAARRALGALERFRDHLNPFTVPASVMDGYRTEAEKSLEEASIAAKSIGDQNVSNLLGAYHVNAIQHCQPCLAAEWKRSSTVGPSHVLP